MVSAVNLHMRLVEGVNVDAAKGCTTVFAVPEMHCGGCMRKVEAALTALPGVTAARANLSARRVSVVTLAKPDTAEPFIDALARTGFQATVLADKTRPISDATRGGARDGDLLRRLGVAGFAAANIMLLSVSVWSGHASDMPASLQTLFHWLSAAIALPAVAYAGQPFFASARQALAARRLNMDVPISLGVVLATLMSLYQTWRGSEQVYFDAAITLLFFLLIGRVLDQRMRARAESAAENLLGLVSPACTLVDRDGATTRIATTDVLPHMRVRVSAGERIPVDGRVILGRSDIDQGLITGESLPRGITIGDIVHGGTTNLAGPIDIEVTAVADNTLLAEIARLMATAEQARGRYVRLADRAARLYAPAVHVLGLGTFVGWMLAGQGWEPALTAAISVLIITCPCALALAVPAVQVVATNRLFRSGIILKAADGLERLSDIDTVVLDKTGTLTCGEPRLVSNPSVLDPVLADAASLAAHSRHPYSRAFVMAAKVRALPLHGVTDVAEHPGEGLTGYIGGRQVRLGSARFCGAGASANGSVYVRIADEPAVAFVLRDELRKDAMAVVAVLRGRGCKIVMLSGDREAAVAACAAQLSIDTWQAEVSPADKIAYVNNLKRSGAKVLMIGDGLNDAPALAAGTASLSPATAVDVSQAAADAVFQGERLAPVLEALVVARAAQQRALENFAIAIGYNAVFVPLAIAGWVTPLIAAIAMSASSLAVTANALRLARMSPEKST